jgi:hypothetical protein
VLNEPRVLPADDWFYLPASSCVLDGRHAATAFLFNSTHTLDICDRVCIDDFISADTFILKESSFLLSLCVMDVISICMLVCVCVLPYSQLVK